MVGEVTARVSQLDVSLGGSRISPDLGRALAEIEVMNSLNLPDAFTLRFHLNPVEGRASHIPDDVMRDYLSQGTEVVISQRVGNRDKVLFNGEVTAFSLEYSSTVPSGPLFAVVQGYDRSHRLHRGQKTRTFINMSFSDIADQVGSDAGLSVKTDSTSGVHDYVIQSNQTDWEFLRQLAGRAGHELYVNGKTMFFKKPDYGSSPKVVLEWGTDLMQFRMRSSTAFQVPTVTVRGWDPKKKESIVGEATPQRAGVKTKEKRAGSDQAKKAFGKSGLVVTDRPVRNQAEAQAIAESLSDSIAGAFVEAEGVTSQGTGEIAPRVQVEVRGLGRSSGTYYVTASTHRYTGQNGYTTSFVVSGRRPHTLLEFVDGRSASMDQSRIHGVVVGVVTNNDDPEGLSRVKVKFPWLDERVESDWARLAAPGAGRESGMHWLPHVDDEVLVVFEHGDIHRPYVLGGLWNSSDAPPAANADIVQNGSVTLHGMTTREGASLVFSDEQGDRWVKLSADSDNMIQISRDKRTVKIVCAGDITIEGGQGKITVEGRDLEIKSASNLKLEASANLEIKAGVNLTLKANAQASLEGSAMTEVKGGIVRIN